MTAPKIYISCTDQENSNEEEPLVKRHFQPGKILEGIRKEQMRVAEKMQYAESTEGVSNAVVVGDSLEETIDVAEPAVGRPEADRTAVDIPVETIDEGSTFEAAFAHLKGSKYYQAPEEPKTKEEGSPKKILSSKTNSVLVSSRQKGNPLLKSIRNVPWEFAEIEADYVMGQSTCALFLSLRYFNLYPHYIHERLKTLGKSYQLRIMLVMVDVTDPYPPLRDISRIAIYTDCTLMLAWSSEEAGRYIETYKILENKSADLLKEKQEDDTYSKIVDSLTKVKSVNQTNATTLLTTYGCLDKVMKASPEELSLLPGMGPNKAKKLHSVIHQPFRKSKPA